LRFVAMKRHPVFAFWNTQTWIDSPVWICHIVARFEKRAKSEPPKKVA